ncbi:MAG: hypothetical protein ACTS2F_02525 [Thainema sp.]
MHKPPYLLSQQAMGSRSIFTNLYRTSWQATQKTASVFRLTAIATNYTCQLH